MSKRSPGHVALRRSRLAAATAKYAAATASLTSGDDVPSQAEFDFESLHCLIETRVVKRLEAIFQAVRHAGALTGLGSIAPQEAIRLPEVLALLGISKSTLYGRLNPKSRTYDPRMPQPFKLGNSPRSVSAWLRSDIDRYLESCAGARTLH